MTRTVLTLGVLGVAFAVLISPPAPAQDKDKDKGGKGDAKLTGGYTIVGGEKFGQPVPKDRIEGTVVRFTDDKVTVTDKSTKETYAATYKVDGGKITMTSTIGPNKGETVKGLIAKEGDMVKLIYALPGGEMPTDFKTKDKQLMFMMKNMNK